MNERRRRDKETEEIEAFGTHTVVQEWSIGVDNHDECDEPGCDAGICVGVRLEPSEEQREAGARHLELNLDQAEAEDFADSLAQMMHEAWPAAHAVNLAPMRRNVAELPEEWAGMLEEEAGKVLGLFETKLSQMGEFPNAPTGYADAFRAELARQLWDPPPQAPATLLALRAP